MCSHVIYNSLLTVTCRCALLFACISPPSPIAIPHPPSSSAKAGAKATKPASAPWPISPIGPRRKSKPFAACCATSPLVSPQDLCTTEKTLPHGHVQAILDMIGKLELQGILSAQHCRERDLVVAMIVQRLISPASKLATTREWHTTTLAEELGVGEASEDDLYQAMDWL